MTGLVVIVLALAAGAWLGRRLARLGVTADNALKGRQGLAWAILGSVTAAGLLLYFGPRVAFMPTFAVLYGEAASLHTARVAAAFSLALLVTLEWPGRRDARRLRQIAVGSSILLGLSAWLGWRSMPLRVRESWVHDNVVMQTTAFTCAPSAIATLVRWYGGDTTATEASVVALAGTTREGTNTLSELAAMRRLGLAPRYARGLSPESLAVQRRPALLHVNEPVASGVTVRHAVALLAIDSAASSITIGNPLHGLQRMRLEQLRGYWTGEAVFLGAATLRQRR